MKRRNILRQSKGLTLVELLVVTAIMGLVVVGMYSVFLTMNKSTYQQEEVVEVQQNLRVAMGQIARDIRMAGFMIPLGDSPLQVANVDTLTIRTATASGRVAQIATGFNTTSDANRDVIVSTSEMVDLFDTSPEQRNVRIIRPADRAQPINAVLTVAGKDRATQKITLSGLVAGRTFVTGDLIVGVPPSSTFHPRRITYQLQGGNLVRIDGPDPPTPTAQVVASYLTGLDFAYLRADGSTIATPVAGTDLDDIRAVRVTMTAATDPLKTGITGGVKTRQLTQVIRIRNQR